MPNTPAWALPYPNETDPADVPLDIQKLAAKLDTLLTQIKAAGAIPGEVKLWPGATVPDRASFGHWVWADGTDYDSATYPLTSGAIAAAWRTSFGKADPGAGRFRVPDMRGVTPVGLDAMPGGARANRIVRANAIVQAVLEGQELHALTVAELAAHAHGVNDPTHTHPVADPTHTHPTNARTDAGAQTSSFAFGGNHDTATITAAATGVYTTAAYTGLTIASNGGGGAHETMQPSVFVPYICKLDD